MEYEFSAFVSYKRGGDDEKTARAIQRRLERYRIPVADITAEAKLSDLPRRLKVFRDKSDLGSHANLGAGLSENLDASRFLVVICSERSAQSPYVDDEVRHFVESGRSGDIIPLIIDGGAMPPSMPPVAAAIRDLNREEAFIQILSRILRVDYDNLWAAHLRAQRRRAFRWFSLVAVLSALTASLGLWAASAARRATAARLEAEELVDFFVYDLTKATVRYLPYEKMVLVTGLVQEYYEAWAPDEPKARRAAARNSKGRAYVAFANGDLKSAFEMTMQSVEILDALCRGEPQNELYLSDYLGFLEEAGHFSVNLKQTEKAEEYFKKTVEISRQIEDLTPDSLTAKIDLVDNISNLAVLLSRAGRFEEADALFDECTPVWDKIFGFSEDEAEFRTGRMAYADFLSRRGESMSAREDYANALGFCNESLVIHEELYREDQGNILYRGSYAQAVADASDASLKAGEMERADALYDEAEKLFRYEAEYHPQPLNIFRHSTMLTKGAFLRIIQGKPSEALELLDKAERSLDKLINDDPENENYALVKTAIKSFRELANDYPL